MGSGLRPKSDFRHQLASLIPKNITHIPEYVKTFSPDSSSVITASGRVISYDTLVVSAGLQINYGAIKGLPEALADQGSAVSTIYSYETCDRVWSEIESLKTGNAIFTQPAGVIKCAGGSNPLFIDNNFLIGYNSPTEDYVDGLGQIQADESGKYPG